MDSPVVETRDVTKRFGPTVASDRVSVAFRAGEVHALLGENGAGKTTLVSLLSGMDRPDAGEILVDGRPVRIGSPAAALRLGIGTVYQHFTLVPTLSVIENVVLGTGRGAVLDLVDAERRLADLLDDLGLSASPRMEVRHLAIGQQQRVEIVKALFRGSRVLLLDEPTSVLTPGEVEGLLAILRRLKAQGVAVVLITHKLDEALAVSDRVSVLRAGRKVAELGPEALVGTGRAESKRRVVELMFGGGVTTAPPRRTATAGPTLLSLEGVTARGSRGVVALRDVSLNLRAGEVLGIAGVEGNGQKELGEVVAGQRPVASGRVVLAGQEITNRGVAHAVNHGIGYVTDDALHEGCVPSASVAANVALKEVGRAPFSNGFWLDRAAIDRRARELIGAFGVKAPGPETQISLLSGGNIKKLLLARELALDPRVLVCNKPTSGLDLQTTRFVVETLRAEADAGKAVLLISSELDEILDVSDRIGVIFGGRLVGVFPRAEADRAAVGRLMLGGGGADVAGPA
ncbi:MAG: ABC transporter ATP-binding protein [Chloroflexota bacterium]|nr:ABC transporter ATP-binding protein [Chloroflexota bacterium]